MVLHFHSSILTPIYKFFVSIDDSLTDLEFEEDHNVLINFDGAYASSKLWV